MDPSPYPNIGTILDGRYELTEFIAEGGMGRVYKAIQRTLDRVVAVKLLKDFSEGSSEFQKRFFLEASDLYAGRCRCTALKLKWEQTAADSRGWFIPPALTPTRMGSTTTATLMTTATGSRTQ